MNTERLMIVLLGAAEKCNRASELVEIIRNAFDTLTDDEHKEFTRAIQSAVTKL